MKPKTVQHILDDPEFKTMTRKKSTLAWFFSIAMFIIYVIYILYIGFDPEAFATPVKEGATTTWGIYAGLFVILFAVFITGIYVHKANGQYEDMTIRVVKKAQEEISHE